MALSEIESKEWGLSGIFSFLDTGAFSDSEIHVGEHVFKVHRIVLCQKSKCFAKLNSEDWTVGGSSKVQDWIANLFLKSGKTAQATFPDDEPEIIARLLIFLYKGSYPEGDIAKYGIQQFTTIIDHYYKPGSLEALHAQMYALAAQLDIEELYEISRAAFKDRYDHATVHLRTDWVDLVKYIYTSTAPAEKHLRRIVLHGMQNALTNSHSQVRDTNLYEAIKAVPDFAFDLATTMVNDPANGNYHCPACSHFQTVLFERCSHGWAGECGKSCYGDTLSQTECSNCQNVGLRY